MYAQSKKTAGDLVQLRTLVAQSLKWKYHPGDPIFGGLGCNLTRKIARQLIHFPHIHVLFFCDGEGDVESVSRLCSEWKPRTGGAGVQKADVAGGVELEYKKLRSRCWWPCILL